jgi:hypothetical protein
LFVVVLALLCVLGQCAVPVASTLVDASSRVRESGATDSYTCILYGIVAVSVEVIAFGTRTAGMLAAAANANSSFWMGALCIAESRCDWNFKAAAIGHGMTPGACHFEM